MLDEKLSAVLNVRLTCAEKSSLECDAEMAGISVSALVRRRALQRQAANNYTLSIILQLRRIHSAISSTRVCDRATESAILDAIADAIDRIAK